MTELDPRIDESRIREALMFAEKNKDFADTSAANLDDHPPVGLFGTDPDLVREIAALEKKIEDVYNTTFLTDPGSLLNHYTESPDLLFFDILIPGEYHGDEFKSYAEFIGPAFIGRLEFKELRITAQGTFGMVTMKQNYYGKDLEGNPIHWIMRQTDGVVKRDGVWKVAHTHISFPINIQTRVADLTSPKRPFPWGAHKAG